MCPPHLWLFGKLHENRLPIHLLIQQNLPPRISNESDPMSSRYLHISAPSVRFKAWSWLQCPLPGCQNKQCTAALCQPLNSASSQISSSPTPQKKEDASMTSLTQLSSSESMIDFSAQWPGLVPSVSIAYCDAKNSLKKPFPSFNEQTLLENVPQRTEK